MTPFLSTGKGLWGRLALAHAKVAELADAPDLGSGSRKALGVQLPPFAPAFAAPKLLPVAASARQAVPIAKRRRASSRQASESPLAKSVAPKRRSREGGPSRYS